MKYKHIIDKTNFELSYFNRFYDKIRKVTGHPILDMHFYERFGQRFGVHIIDKSPRVITQMSMESFCPKLGGNFKTEEKELPLELLTDKFGNCVEFCYYDDILFLCKVDEHYSHRTVFDWEFDEHGYYVSDYEYDNNGFIVLIGSAYGMKIKLTIIEKDKIRYMWE